MILRWGVRGAGFNTRVGPFIPCRRFLLVT